MRTLLPVLLLTACGGDPCAPPGVPTLAIGDGRGRYAPVDDGDPLPLVHGPQGGYHLELGLEATDIDADGLLSAVVTGTLDGEVAATAAPWVELVCDEEAGALRSFGTLLVYDRRPEDLDGEATTIRVELTDASGLTVEASLQAVIDDRGPQP